MMKSEIVLKSALQDAAITLLMVGPSREFAAGVALSVRHSALPHQPCSTLSSHAGMSGR